MPQQLSATETNDDRRRAIVSKATLRAAEKLGFTNALMARILGVSEPTVSRMRAGAYTLPAGSKTYELALLFLRLYRSIDAILGGDETSVRSWFLTENAVLRAKPVDRIVTVQGLVATADYVDSRRAPL